MKQRAILEYITKELIDENQVTLFLENGKEVFYRIYDEYYYEYIPSYEKGSLRCNKGYKNFNRMKKLVKPSNDKIFKIGLKKGGNEIIVTTEEFCLI